MQANGLDRNPLIDIFLSLSEALDKSMAYAYKTDFQLINRTTKQLMEIADALLDRILQEEDNMEY